MSLLDVDYKEHALVCQGDFGEILGHKSGVLFPNFADGVAGIRIPAMIHVPHEGNINV